VRITCREGGVAGACTGLASGLLDTAAAGPERGSVDSPAKKHIWYQCYYGTLPVAVCLREEVPLKARQ